MSLTDAQQALAQTMSDISEFCWFARWMSGTEYRLWRFVTDPNDDEPWGNYPIPPEYRERLSHLSETAGGWIHWRDDSGGPAFIPRTEWELVFGAWWRGRQDDIEAHKRLPRRYADLAEWFAQQSRDSDREEG
jgi:hypothetical protein